MILGIDGTNWIHTLWYAAGHDAIDLALNRLRAITNHALHVTGTEPLGVIVCWDRHSFRHDLYPPYKSDRKEKEPELIKALDSAPDILGQEATQLAVDGFEADDLLASLAHTATLTNQKAVICSADRDLYQCLRAGQVSVLTNFKTYRGQICMPQWVTESTLIRDHNIKPSQWVDYQCLVGEKGDSVPGCLGWGPVNAEKALSKFGSIDQMLSLLTPGPNYNPWVFPGYKRGQLPAKFQALLDWQEQYPLTKQLIELRVDVDVMDCLR